MRFFVEQAPNGSWRVMLRGSHAPISVHDTEEEARERLSSYARGAAAAAGPAPQQRGPGARAPAAGAAGVTELPVLAFPSRNAFREWLDAEHARSPGLWLRIARKATRGPSVTYAEALDVALCYGWID